MKIAIVAAEIGPYAKAGGLADVIGALPQALKRAGADPVVILPGYQALLEQTDSAVVDNHRTIDLGGAAESYRLLSARAAGDVPLYLIDHPGFFGREGIYGENGVDYADNHRRFTFFGRAAATAAADLAPEILNTHDWHAASATIVARADPATRARLERTVAAFTIHNMAFQGLLESYEFPLLGIDWSWYTVANLEFYGRANLMKGAIVLADGVSTVSPTYAYEVAHDATLGFGLEGTLRDKGDRFVGILNGADYDEWDPARDDLIAARYSPTRRAGKRACVYALREELKLPHHSDTPVIGMVTRMTEQKGIDILIGALDQLLALEVQLVMLASGDHEHERFFAEAVGRYRDRLRVITRFDNGLAHRIQAGSAMFLMPSRYEPCGLTQMYALKYGSIPIVRATGGLKDTIDDFDPANGLGNGFVFEEYTPRALIEAVAHAVGVFRNNRMWTRLMQNGYKADFSWDRVAVEYLEWFEHLRQLRGLS